MMSSLEKEKNIQLHLSKLVCLWQFKILAMAKALKLSAFVTFDKLLLLLLSFDLPLH